jgi:hypothetical protein
VIVLKELLNLLRYSLQFYNHLFFLFFSGLHYVVVCWVDASIMEKHTAYPEDGSRMLNCFIGTHPIDCMVS